MKKLLKIILWLAGIFAGLLVLLIIGFKLFFPAEKVRLMAVKQGSEWLDRPVSISAIDLSLWGGLGLRLEGVLIGNPEGFQEGDLLRATDIDLKLELLPLITGKYRIDRLIVNSPNIKMIRTETGLNNYTFEKLEAQAPTEMTEVMPPEAKAAGLAVSFKRLEIVDGRLEYQDDSSAMRFTASGLSLSTSVENPNEGKFNSIGELTIDSLLLSSQSSLPSLQLGLKYQAAFDLSLGTLTIGEADLSVDELACQLNGVFHLGSEPFSGQLHLRSQGTAISDLLKTIPEEQKKPIAPIHFSGELDIETDLLFDNSLEKSFVYSGSLKLNGVSMVHDSVPGELQFKRAVLDFEPDNARLNIEDGLFDGRPIKGRLTVDNFSNPTISGELAGNLNLAFITPFLPEESKNQLAGLAGFDVVFSGRADDIEHVTFSGNLKISDGSFSSPDLPEPIDSLQFDAYFDNAVTRINNLSGRIPSGAFRFSGRVNDLLAYLLADSSVSMNRDLIVSGKFEGNLDLAFFQRYLPQEGHPQLSGQVNLNLTLNGTTAKPERMISVGELKISDAAYSDDFLPEKLTHFEAAMSLTPDTITVSKMTARFESSDVSFTGKLAEPFPYLLPIQSLDRSHIRKPLFLFQLSSRRFDIDRLFPEAAPGTGVNRAALPQDSVSLILLPDIDGKGVFSIDTVIYSQVEFTALKGDVKIYDRKIECYNVVGGVYSGKVAGTTTIDLNDFENPVYSGEFKATEVEANDFVSRFSKFGGHLFGKVNLAGNYTASGWDPDEFLNTLTMNSDASMLGGKLVTGGSIHSTVSGLAEKLGESFDKEQTIKQLATKLLVKDGKVILDNLTTKLGVIGEVTVGGAYSFTGDLNYKGSILLSKEWTRKLMSSGGMLGGLTGLFSDKSVEQVRLPIVIAGTADSPQMDIDYSALGEAMGDKVKDKAQNLLKGLIKK